MIAYFSGDAEAGVTLTGAWTQGPPVYGLRVPRTAPSVFSTGRTGPYPAAVGTATLELRPLDLSQTPATLSFWYWTDVERGGQCRTVCDGGRVEVSTAPGLWEPLAIEGGYPDTVDARFGGGLAGQPVLPGDSYGWQRALARLPQGPAVRVRFAFGTDAGNTYTTTYGYAGLALDSIAVTTARPGAGPRADDRGRRARRDARGGRRRAPPCARGHAGPRARGGARRRGARRIGREERFRPPPPAPGQPDGLRGAPARPPDAGRRRRADALPPHPGRRAPASNCTAAERAVRTLARTRVLAGATPAGLWHPLGAGFSAYRPSNTEPAITRTVSPLVLAPLDLPANADALTLVVRHRYRLGTPSATGPAGNVKVSADDGHTWAVLPGAYPVAALPGGHPLAGEPGFAGTSPGDTLTTRFDLRAYAGQQVRIRFDLGHAQGLSLGQTWTVLDVSTEAATPAAALETPRTLGLSAPFPNPFGAQLSFAYTLPAAAVVEAALFDVLGRRVRTFVGRAMQEPGTYPVTLATGDLPAGLYVLRLRLGAEMITRTVTKVR